MDLVSEKTALRVDLVSDKTALRISDTRSIVGLTCPICYDLVDGDPLECGHYFHLECLEGHFKAECPSCKTPHTLVIPCGTMPSPDRSRSYIRSTAHNEKIIVKIKGPHTPEDKLRVESLLTFKHRGEKLSDHNARELRRLFGIFAGIDIIIVDDPNAPQGE